MVNSFLFNGERPERMEDWQAALESIGRRELLWSALRDTTERGESAVWQELELGPTEARRLRESPDRASVVMTESTST